MSVLDPETEQKISEVLSSTCVLAGYIFGSMTTGRNTPSSDLDVGVLFPEAMPVKKRVKRQEILRERLLNVPSGGSTNEVDVVDIREAPLSLQFHIIKHGEVIVGSENPDRKIFSFRVRRTYQDRKYYRDRHLQTFFSRTAREGIL